MALETPLQELRKRRVPFVRESLIASWGPEVLLKRRVVNLHFVATLSSWQFEIFEFEFHSGVLALLNLLLGWFATQTLQDLQFEQIFIACSNNEQQNSVRNARHNEIATSFMAQDRSAN